MKKCERCGRKLKGQNVLGRVCLQKRKQEMLNEIRAVGFDGKVYKQGVQLLLSFSDSFEK